MGRKLPKKAGHGKKKVLHNEVFPECIGKFPECVDYTAEMTLELRTECKSCPYRKKSTY